MILRCRWPKISLFTSALLNIHSFKYCTLRDPVAPRAISVISVAIFLSIAIAPISAFADAGLQLNPLKYEDKITTDTVRRGYIDVANPGDSTVKVETSVRGFRQIDLDGNLAFFDDRALTAGIIPDLGTFDLGPRDAIRMYFSVAPKKLPRGAIYGAIFFRTVPEQGQSDNSYLTASANLGTLVILQNGAADKPTSQIVNVNFPFLQLGSVLSGQASVLNTSGQSAAPFNAALKAKISPFGQSISVASGLVMPGTTRIFRISRNGSYFGLLPVTLRDTVTGASTTTWIFACTGYFPYLLTVLLVLTILAWILIRIMTRRRLQKPLRKMSMRDIKPLRKP